jgi:hypothetical protein
MAISQKTAQYVSLVMVLLANISCFAGAALVNDDYYNYSRFYNKQSTRAMQLDELKRTNNQYEAFVQREAQLVAHPVADPGVGSDRTAYDRYNSELVRTRTIISNLMESLDKLAKPETVSGKVGTAFLQGFAGKDAQLFVGERVDSAATGIGLGIAVSSAQAVSKIVSQHVETTTEKLLGGFWDTFVSKIIDCVEFFNNSLFHDGYEPYSVVTLRGLQTMVKDTFSNLNLMVKDSQSFLRGEDMTLRPTENQQDPVVAKLKGWDELCEAHTRQFQRVIIILDSRIQHYDEESDVVWYANEIKRCIFSVRTILCQVQSLRELNERLESNKNLLPAFGKNIDNLFNRLIELISPEPKGQTSNPTQAKQSQSSRPSYGDDDGGLHSFR